MEIALALQISASVSGLHELFLLFDSGQKERSYPRALLYT